MTADWLPIESAPRDRTPVIIAAKHWRNDSRISGEAYFEPGHKEEGDWWWANTGDGNHGESSLMETDWHPYAWMPLPDPPAAGS